jgi:hypothetical protein
MTSLFLSVRRRYVTGGGRLDVEQWQCRAICPESGPNRTIQVIQHVKKYGALEGNS